MIGKELNISVWGQMLCGLWSSIGQKFSHPLLPFPVLPKLQCLCTYIWSGNSLVSSVLFCGARNGIVQTLKKPPVVHGAWWVGLLPVMKLFVFDWITYSDVQEVMEITTGGVFVVF